MNIRELIKEAETTIGLNFTMILEAGFELAPYLSKFLQTKKINRLNTRLNNHIDQLKRIDKLFSNAKISSEFIQEKIGPIVLSDLIEEHEEAKMVYLLNGFENVFINENTNESLIINYYDTLRELRYEDIRRLYYYAAITDELPLDKEMNNELIIMQKQIYSKLERLYIVKSAKTYASIQYGSEELNDDERRVELTTYGANFVKFISLEFDENKYNSKIQNYVVNEDEKIKPLTFEEFNL